MTGDIVIFHSWENIGTVFKWYRYFFGSPQLEPGNVSFIERDLEQQCSVSFYGHHVVYVY